MTYSKYLQEFVGIKGILTKLHEAGVYQFVVGGNSVLQAVGDDFVCIKSTAFLGNDYCECIPLNLFVFKFDEK
jgi:hypothetical protein